MVTYYKNDKIIDTIGYEVFFTRYADSILNYHFNEARLELIKILEDFFISEDQIVEGGGGLSSITQRLGQALKDKKWLKENIEITQHVRGKVLGSESHEVDHYKSFNQGNICLEIEWNNKDPFYDRDLENFRKLHQLGELSLGIIITRGASLQIELLKVFLRFLASIYPFTIEKLCEHIFLSTKDQAIIKPMIALPREKSLSMIASKIYTSKYGSTTTHMEKLLLRIDRGVGNPCPLILIGIGKERIKYSYDVQI